MKLNQVFGLDGLMALYLEIAILKAVDDGLIDLCVPLADYLPGFNTEASKQIIVEQLLRHTSGLNGVGYRKLDKEYDSIYEAVQEVADHGPNVTPGTMHIGNWINYDIMLVLLETVSNQSIHDFMSEKFFVPLGLDSTSFDLSKTPSLKSNLVSRYSLSLNGLYLKAWDRDTSIEHLHGWPSRTGFSSISDAAVFLSIWNEGQVQGLEVTSKDTFKRWREILYAGPNENDVTECLFDKLRQDKDYQYTNVRRWMPSVFGPMVTILSDHNFMALYFTQVPYNDSNTVFWQRIAKILRNLDLDG